MKEEFLAKISSSIEQLANTDPAVMSATIKQLRLNLYLTNTLNKQAVIVICSNYIALYLALTQEK